MSDEINEKLKTIRGKISKLAQAGGIFFLEIVKVAVLAGITIAFVRYFLFKPFYVKGASMEPNFYEHEYLLIDELSYRFREPVRGEVIVFRYPDNPKEHFLKRIIGLPGERIKIVEGEVIIYNQDYPEGYSIEEKYLPDDLATLGGRPKIELGLDEYYVLGDNRNNSYDSRRFGPITKEYFVGRTWFRGWPFDRVQTFHAPEFDM